MKTFYVVLIFSLFAILPARARDDDRFVGSPLHAWFEHLMSGRGLCCSFADGVRIADVDWEIQNGKYRVRLYGEWIAIPDEAVVTEPNLFGSAVVWPYMAFDGTVQVRCFLPGAGL